MEHQESDSPALLLRGDNFTPPVRTPWGGHRIRALKGLAAGPIVGESWELSVEPSFPSVTERGAPLEDALPAPTGLLVKLLDAAQALSVQIHPSDSDPRLAADESGKPEAWYVVAREPGAGLWLGLEPGVDEARMRAAIEAGDDVSKLLHFVAVEPGDAFLIEAGTPHCIGAGVFVVEPQRVRPGRRGLTYRYWDWNRRYDEAGRVDPLGAPRELHLEAALAVTRWDRPRGPELLSRVRARPGAVSRGPAALRPLIGSSAPVSSDHLVVRRLEGSGPISIDVPALAALTVLSGRVEASAHVLVPPGRTAALRPGAHTMTLESAHAVLSWLPDDDA